MKIENLFILYLIACVLYVAFIASLFLILLGAERWSPWATYEIDTPWVATATATSKPEEPTATREPTRPIAGGNFTALPLPDGTAIVHGTASDGTTYPYCFYWAPTREIVLAEGCGERNRVHEFCHAHQHWSINGGAALLPSDYDLESWYASDEGRSFAAAIDGLPFPWMQSAANGLEDFAWTCTYWYLNPERLVSVGGSERYRWVKENLP